MIFFIFFIQIKPIFIYFYAFLNNQILRNKKCIRILYIIQKTHLLHFCYKYKFFSGKSS